MKPLKHKDPGLAQLILTAGSGIVLGLLAGAAYLLSMPVSRAAKVPDAALLDKPGELTTYYTPGATASVDSPTLSSRLSRIERRTPGPLTFTEEEVNRYIQSLREEAKDAAAAPQGEAAPESELKIDSINVRIADGEMLWGMKKVLNPTTDPFEMLVQMTAHFENTESEGPRFVIDSIRLNSMPVPSLAGAVPAMIVGKLSDMGWPEHLVRKWENIKEIQLQDKAMVVTVGPRG